MRTYKRNLTAKELDTIHAKNREVSEHNAKRVERRKANTKTSDSEGKLEQRDSKEKMEGKDSKVRQAEMKDESSNMRNETS